MTSYRESGVEHPPSVPQIESQERRKAVKKIVCGVTALAAYHVMPAKWGTPIIEQVFLPAHAQTSGGLVNGNFRGNVGINITANTGIETPQELLAQIGDAVSDFLVSEANARPAGYDWDWCVTIDNDTATYNCDKGFGCVIFSGPTDGVATYTQHGEQYTGQILSGDSNSVEVQVTYAACSNTFSGTGTLIRSTVICGCAT